jgi:hypothetical protein
MPHKRIQFLALLVVLIGTASVLSFVSPSTALGADIVTCGDDVVVEYGAGDCPSGNCICYTGECSVCDAQTLAWNVLNWLISIAIIIAALLFVNAGVLYVMSPSNPGNIARAHKIFTNTLIGLVIILSAWLLIDVVMKSLFNENAGDVAYGPWNNFLCSGTSYATYCVDQMDKIVIKGGEPAPQEPGTPPPAGGGPTPTPRPDGPYSCRDPKSVADAHGTVYPRTNHPDLTALIACYRADPNIAALLGTVYTYENSNDTCNYTHGVPSCGKCAHGQYSCHYGGGLGQGAMAADFNSRGSEAALCARVRARQGVCRGNVICQSAGHFDHTHVSTASCPRR